MNVMKYANLDHSVGLRHVAKLDTRPQMDSVRSVAHGLHPTGDDGLGIPITDRLKSINNGAES